MHSYTTQLLKPPVIFLFLNLALKSSNFLATTEAMPPSRLITGKILELVLQDPQALQKFFNTIPRADEAAAVDAVIRMQANDEAIPRASVIVDVAQAVHHFGALGDVSNEGKFAKCRAALLDSERVKNDPEYHFAPAIMHDRAADEIDTVDMIRSITRRLVESARRLLARAKVADPDAELDTDAAGLLAGGEGHYNVSEQELKRIALAVYQAGAYITQLNKTEIELSYEQACACAKQFFQTLTPLEREQVVCILDKLMEIVEDSTYQGSPARVERNS
jgi:hypothetical protein